MTKLIIVFRNFTNAPTNAVVAAMCTVCINLCIKGRTKGRANRTTSRGAKPMRGHQYVIRIISSRGAGKLRLPHAKQFVRKFETRVFENLRQRCLNKKKRFVEFQFEWGAKLLARPGRQIISPAGASNY